MKRTMLVAATIGAAITVLAAGCGGKQPAASSGSPATTATTGATAKGATVATRGSKLGKILVDASGRTLYLFERDKAGTSSCSGGCATAWPPYTTSGQPQAGSGTAAAELGTTARSDGKTQVTYHGHPLYYYVGDSKVGDTTGEGVNAFGAEWYVLSPSGNKIEKEGS
jgi:predicted lipoprotein with Yx(FWY)xxD motif